MTESSTANKPLLVAGMPTVFRYAVTVNVRPVGSLGQFDPHGITVSAVTAEHAIDVATARAHQLGWEVCGATIASVGRA